LKQFRFLIDDEFNVNNEDEVEDSLHRGNKRLEVDVGKLKALRDAGWSVEKIAEEMKISKPTVYKRLKEIEQNG
jgi:predicted transcriptional regulator